VRQQMTADQRVQNNSQSDPLIVIWRRIGHGKGYWALPTPDAGLASSLLYSSVSRRTHSVPEYPNWPLARHTLMPWYNYPSRGRIKLIVDRDKPPLTLCTGLAHLLRRDLKWPDPPFGTSFSF